MRFSESGVGQVWGSVKMNFSQCKVEKMCSWGHGMLIRCEVERYDVTWLWGWENVKKRNSTCWCMSLHLLFNSKQVQGLWSYRHESLSKFRSSTVMSNKSVPHQLVHLTKEKCAVEKMGCWEDVRLTSMIRNDSYDVTWVWRWENVKVRWNEAQWVRCWWEHCEIETCDVKWMWD
jgi:hypothetical protein